MGKKDKITAEEKSLSLGASLAPAVVAGGATGVAYKLDRDLSKVTDRLEEWDNSLKSSKEHFNRGGAVSPSRADKVFKNYIEGGRRLARERVLGIPGGRIMQAVEGAKEKVPIVIADVLGQHVPQGRRMDAKHRVGHYRLFSDPKTSYSELKAHMIEKSMHPADKGDPIHEMKKSITPKAQEIISDTKKYPTFGSQLKALRRAGEFSSAGTLSRAIKGGGGSIGETVRLAGNAKDVISTSELYKNNLRPLIEGTQNILKPVKTYLPMGALGLLGLGGVIYGVDKMKKKASLTEEKKDKYRNRALSGGALVASAPIVASGVNKIIKPPKDIAITYGTMPNIGMGHKSPGQAIGKILRSDPRLAKANIEFLERDRHGLFRSLGKRFNILIDTGLGGETQDWAKSQTRKTHGYTMPDRIKAQSKVRYLTDALTTRGSMGSNIIGKKRRERVWSYGENTDQIREQTRRKNVNLNPKGMTPAIDPDVVKELKSINKQPLNPRKVLDQVISHQNTILSTGSHTPAAANVLQSVHDLENLKEKKIITIAGAGRGDYVASRAKEVAEALTKSGLDKEYGVVALMAEGHGGETQAILKGQKNVASVGKLPRELFNKVQGSSEINWGVTGTSSVTESLMQRNVQAVPGEWGGFSGENNTPKPSSIAGRQDAMLGKRGPHADLDAWNAGNREYVLGQKGTAKIDSGEDLVAILKDKSRLENLKRESVVRSAEQFKNYDIGVSNLKNEAAKLWKSGVRKARSRGAIIAGSGLALAGLGAYGLKKSYEKKD